MKIGSSASFEASPRRSNENRINLAPKTDITARCVERAPIPPESLRGIEGMKKADEMLKEMGVIGILIGGLAKRICMQGETDPSELEKHKDVDVLIPSIYHEFIYHPRQWQNGIDWWITHAEDEAPTNGLANLIQAPTIDTGWKLSKNKDKSGLYICPPNVLLTMENLEHEKLGTIKNTPNIEDAFGIGEFRGGFSGKKAEAYHKLDEKLANFKYKMFSPEYISFQGGYTNWDYKPIEQLIKKAQHCKPIK